MLLDVIRRWRGHLPKAEMEQFEVRIGVRRQARLARRATAGQAALVINDHAAAILNPA